MDNRIRNAAIAVSAFALLLITGIVGLANYLQNPSRFSPVSSQTEVSSEQESVNLTREPDSSGFLSDKKFLDEYQPFADRVRENSEEKKALLLATSVAGDLRVLVIDEEGQLITGETFVLNIGSTGSYKDLDQDGSIYIAGLKPGDYKVSLQEKEGFSVSAERIMVSVKDNISYEKIADISYLIKTEADINAEEEDTEIMDAALDMDGTEMTGFVHDADKAIQGIDVSKWNKEIDWEKVKAAGVEFAIIRCGYRGSKTGTLVEDPYFRKNIEGAHAAGVEVGVYFFTQAINETEAVEEASAVLSLIDGYAVSYPIFIDTESAKGRADEIDNNTRTLICRAFCETIRAEGYSSGVYACRNWFSTKLDSVSLNEYSIWLAEYRKTPLYTGKYNIWQYTSSGSVDGVNGRVDLDLYFTE